jgi:hypothetical protein
MNKTMNTFKRIAIYTGGGDAPGLNAVKISEEIQPVVSFNESGSP